MKKLNVNRVLDLHQSDSSESLAIARLANCNIGRFGFDRRTPLFIKNKANQKSVIRYGFGNNGSIKKLHRHAIALNYDSMNELDVKPDQDVDLIVTKATLTQQIDWLLHHSDLNVRLSMRFALLGAGLGVISLFISL
ncbi:hypothetical protein [Photobacterium leiognathi]|uniref:hypothetical protein n=1 Tax=Photobacterium leiognathi TaxID=553611 RepID=UPI00298262E6|nr:hypothetical protein [Photobacterium leiognathi]